MENDTIRLIYHNPGAGATMSGTIMLPGGERLVVDADGGINLPRRYSHMIEALRGQRWVTVDEYNDIVKRAARMREQHELYPFNCRQILEYAREHDVKLELRGAALWANMPVDADPAFQRSLGYRKDEVTAELQARDKRWTKIS